MINDSAQKQGTTREITTSGQGPSDKILFFEELFRSSLLDRLRVGSELVNLAHQFHRIEPRYIEKHRAVLTEKKLALLGSFSTQHLTSILNLYLIRKGILPKIYEGAYNNIEFEVLSQDSGMHAFAPEILILLMSHEVLHQQPSLFATNEDIEVWVEQTAAHFRLWWERAHAGGITQIFHPLLPAPLFRPLGTLEANYLFSPTNLVRRLNLELVKTRPHYVTLVDLEAMASQVGKENWIDERSAFLSKQGLAMDYFGVLARTLANLVATMAGKEKKCLVLDLDNTLWGGIVGDDGLDGIKLDPTDPVGEAFLAFQIYVKRLNQRGVILAVCSKNSEENARLPFQKHPNMVLRLDDIAIFVANWEHKVVNLRTIASRLNIGLDSLVFLDDNPAEREQVRQFLPEVSVVELPEDPAGFVRALDLGGHFDWLQLSREDLERGNTYVAESHREELLSETGDFDQYLRSLEMQVTFLPVAQATLPRFTQLINKTNQFNLRTIRYSPGAISEFLKDDNRRLVAADFRDRFSHFGIVSCLILEKQDDALFIDTWVMSCRVFKRGLEYAVINHVFNLARDIGCERIIGEYRPTEKNGIVKSLFMDLGFESIPSRTGEPSETSRFEILPGQATPKNHFIRVL